jgi:cobalt-zinc-cadmium efflux system outer membrane protein
MIAGLSIAGAAVAGPPESEVRQLPPVAAPSAPIAQASSVSVSQFSFPPIQTPGFVNAASASSSLPTAFPPAPTENTAELIVPGALAPSAQQFHLPDLEQIALANNPTLARANARVQAAQGNWLQVGLYPNPTGGYSTAEIGDEGQAGQQGGMIEQEIVMGHKLKLNRAIAAQEVQQAQHQREAQAQRVLTDVRTQFYNVLVAQQKVELAQRLVGIGGQGVNATERLFQAQEVSRADLLQARIEANTARILAENARNEYLSAWRKLAAVLGMPCLTQATLVGDMRTDLAVIQWDAALQRILTTSPEVAAAQAFVERARAAIDRAQAEPIPNVDMQLTGQHDNATGDNILGVQAVIPIPIWNRNQGGINKAQAEFAAAKSDVMRVQLSLQQRLAEVYERYSNARHQVERYEQNILPDAQASLDLVNEAYKQGEFGYLILLTAQRTYFQTNLAYLDALRQLRESTVEIEGLLLRGSLQSGE